MIASVRAMAGAGWSGRRRAGHARRGTVIFGIAQIRSKTGRAAVLCRVSGIDGLLDLDSG